MIQRAQSAGGFTLIEAVIALSTASIILTAVAGSAVLVNQTLAPSGFAQLSTGESVPLAPSYTGEAAARTVEASLNDLRGQSCWIFGADSVPAESWAPPASQWVALSALSPAQFQLPPAATTQLQGLGVPLVAGFSVFFVRSDSSLAGVLAVQTSTSDGYILYRVSVRRGGSAAPLVSYSFVENASFPQTTPALVAIDRPDALRPFLVVTLPDPSLSYSTDAAKLVAQGGSDALLRRTSTHSFVLPCLN